MAVWTKKLTRNDVGETSKQSAFYIPKDLRALSVFPDLNESEKNPGEKIILHDAVHGNEWEFDFIYYNNKKIDGKTRDEYRLKGTMPFVEWGDAKVGDEVCFGKDSNGRYSIEFKPRRKVTGLDATFSISSRIGDSTFIHFESSGGKGRNTEYLEGLEVLLFSLGELDGILFDALVDTSQTVDRDEEARRLSPGCDYPIVLSNIDDVVSFRRALTKSASEKARRDPDGKGGNITRRLRFEIVFPKYLSTPALLNALSGSKAVSRDGSGRPARRSEKEPRSFEWNPKPPEGEHKGSSRKSVDKTVMAHVEKKMKNELYERLVKEWGDDGDVGAEHPMPSYGYSDVMVRTKEGFVIYELKKCLSPRECIREALGQLCEYAKWPESPPVIELVVVGRTPIDRHAEKYVASLREDYRLPIRYEDISVD